MSGVNGVGFDLASASWIKTLSLTLWDKQILQKEQLNANLVNSGQLLLRKAHSLQTGLQDTSYLRDLLIWRSEPQGFVQIIFISSSYKILTISYLIYMYVYIFFKLFIF